MSGNAKKIALLIGLLVVGAGAVWYANRKSPEEIARSEHYRMIREQRAAGTSDTTASGDKSKAAAGAAAEEFASQFETADVDIAALRESIKDVEFEYNIARLSRDPMSPLIGLQAGGPSKVGGEPVPGEDQRLIQLARLKAVSGIVWDDMSPIAVIDNEVVTIGYAYPEGIVVDEIHPDHVVFRVNDARVEVELKEQ